MKKFKIGLKYLLGFLVGSLIGIACEGFVRRVTRSLYVTLTDERIRFHQPKLDLYIPSTPFILSIGVYLMAIVYFIGRQDLSQRLINSILSVAFIPAAYAIGCNIDASLKLVVCTACNDGTRMLSYNDIAYTEISIISLIVALMPYAYTEFRWLWLKRHHSLREL